MDSTLVHHNLERNRVEGVPHVNLQDSKVFVVPMVPNDASYFVHYTLNSAWARYTKLMGMEKIARFLSRDSTNTFSRHSPVDLTHRNRSDVQSFLRLRLC